MVEKLKEKGQATNGIVDAARVAASACPSAPDAIGAREIVVRDLIRGLYEGRFEPGQRLFEAELTASFGLSRGPVREAMNALAAMGIVDLTLQRGARVKVLSIDEAIDTLVVAQALVALAARLAAQNIERPGARARLESANKTLAGFDPSSPSVEFARARDQFYAAIGEIAGNDQLNASMPTVRIHLIRVQFRSVLNATDRMRQPDYRRIAAAVLAGRPKAAEMAARMHFNRALDAMRAYRSR